jgi:hypothetical protein
LGTPRSNDVGEARRIDVQSLRAGATFTQKMQRLVEIKVEGA